MGNMRFLLAVAILTVVGAHAASDGVLGLAREGLVACAAKDTVVSSTAGVVPTLARQSQMLANQQQLQPLQPQQLQKLQQLVPQQLEPQQLEPQQLEQQQLEQQQLEPQQLEPRQLQPQRLEQLFKQM